jgi:predicted nucleic acid-binding protein
LNKGFTIANLQENSQSVPKVIQLSKATGKNYQSQSSIAGSVNNVQLIQNGSKKARDESLAFFKQGTKGVGLDDFTFLAVLGKGNFGKVMLAQEKFTNAFYGVKVLKKEFILENDEVERYSMSVDELMFPLPYL